MYLVHHTKRKNDDDDSQMYIAEYEAVLQKEYQRGYEASKAAQPEQEPVAWQFMNGSTFRKRRPEDFSDLAPDGFPYWKPLYTTLPVAKRPWVGLTHEEAQWLYDNCRTQSNLIDMTKAKLKDKNNG